VVTTSGCDACSPRPLPGPVGAFRPKAGLGSVCSIETAAAGLPWRQPQRAELIVRSEHPHLVRRSDFVSVSAEAEPWQLTRLAGP